MRQRKRFPLSRGAKHTSYPGSFYGLQSCSQARNLLAAAKDFYENPPVRALKQPLSWTPLVSFELYPSTHVCWKKNRANNK